MAGLLRAILCLDERYIPPTPGWHAPQDLATWQASSFYVAPEPRPWLLPHDIRRRVAAVNVIGSDGTHAHLVLAEAEQQPPRSSAYLHEMTLHLFPLTGTNEAALLAHLDTLEQEVRAGTTLAHLAYRRFEAWQHHTSAPYTLALVADSAEALLREIERARAGVPAAFAGEQQGEWKTPAGSYFTAQPQGRTGKVAFVYPGAFNAYVGLGQHLFRLFPLLHEQFARITRDAAGTVNDRLLYPRSQTHLAAEEVRDHEAQMLGQSINMLEVGSSFRCSTRLYCAKSLAFSPLSPLVIARARPRWCRRSACGPMVMHAAVPCVSRRCTIPVSQGQSRLCVSSGAPHPIRPPMMSYGRTTF
ncbi:MAG: hypothetical protein HC893_02675 [Chloroflexaceae bacterium]|nr:hypothetical protein [Chloroflexaceae bacterium]